MKTFVRLVICTACAAMLVSCARKAEAPQVDGSHRIVSLAPNLTEIVCALGAGDMLVGRSQFCDYPPGIVADVPVVSGFGDPSLELLVSLKPTLVLEVDVKAKSVRTAIDELGIKREHISCETLEEITKAVRTIGVLLDKQAEAEELALSIEQDISEAQVAKKPGDDAPMVFVEIWHDPYQTAGRKSFISALIEKAGGRNLGDIVDKPFYQVAEEMILELDPDVILDLRMLDTQIGSHEHAKRIGWDGLSAVKNGMVVTDLDPDIILRPGPRVGQALKELKKIVKSVGDKH